MKNYNGIKNTVRLKFITAIMADSTTSDTSTKCELPESNPLEIANVYGKPKIKA